MFQDVSSALARLHLKPKDSAVYVALLKSREGLFVHELVSVTKIKRSTVDVILQRLIDLNFASKVQVGSRYRFFAQSPEAVLFRQEEAVSDFRALLPFLSRLGAPQEQTEIRFFEGRKGVRQIYDDVLMKLKFSEGDGRELVSFSSGADMLKIFPDMQKQFIDKRIRMGVGYRAIVPESALSAPEYRTDEKALRRIKAIDDQKFPFRVAFEVYADSVLIFSPRTPVGGVIIRNEAVASSFRSLFRLVWGLLPDKGAL